MIHCKVAHNSKLPYTMSVGTCTQLRHKEECWYVSKMNITIICIALQYAVVTLVVVVGLHVNR